MTPDHEPVQVRTDPLGTHLGAPVDTAGLEPVSLPGAVAHIDPATPWAPPSITVVDPAAAATVLDELWGPQAVDLVTTGGDGELDGSLAGPGLQALHDLGTARWLRRWRPYPLDPGLLLLDVHRAWAACEGLVDDVPDEDGPDHIGVADLGRSDLAAAQALAARIEATLAPGHAASPTPAWITSLGRPRAAVAASPATPQQQGTVTADWDRVPAGTLSRAESGVHWAIETTSHVSVLHLVSATAGQCPPHPLGPEAPDEPLPGELRFRLYVPGWPLPLVEGLLSPLGSTDTWTGTAPLSSEAAARALQAGPKKVLVDVLRPGLALAPRTGQHALRARAHRWGVRAIAAHRLGQHTTSSAIRTEAMSAVRQAIGAWTALRSSAQADILGRWAAPDDEHNWPAPRLGLAERWSLRHLDAG